MQCTRCGREVRSGSSFCPHCGEPARSAPSGQPAYEPDGGSAETTVLPREPSPFARDATTDEPPAPEPEPPQPTPHLSPKPPPGPPPADAFRFSEPGQPAQPHAPVPPPRSLTEVLAGVSSGALGAVVAAALGALHVLAAFVASLNDDELSKGAFLLLGVLVMAPVGVATYVLWRRAREARLQDRALDAVEALSLGGAVLTTTYGLLLLLTAALSEDGSALQLVF